MTIAVFPGSFDPMTNGHLDIIDRASHLFDEVVVAVGQNTSKTAMFSLDEKLAILTGATQPYDNVQVKVIEGLTVSFVQAIGANVMVRGLRNSTDFDYEQGIALMNHRMSSKIETVFLPAKNENIDISSSLIREISKFGGDVTAMVPAAVIDAMEHRA